MAGTGSAATPEVLEYIHSHKTGSLIRAAVRMGAIAASANSAELAAITAYGTDIGLAFQIADDILNETSSSGKLGKATGSDKALGKITWVSVHGLDESRREAARLAARAIKSLGSSLRGPVEPLAAIARHIVERDR
jgi:geranylgeranyl diphosphate synthase type II